MYTVDTGSGGMVDNAGIGEDDGIVGNNVALHSFSENLDFQRRFGPHW